MTGSFLTDLMMRQRVSCNMMYFMKEAFAQKDEEKVQDLAHKIKGGAVYVGTVKMKMACQYLERYWKAGHRKLFGKLYEQTVTVIEYTIREINQWLNNQ
jgi:two-component system aerobic respiration control sensor histidine kinase ArcB